MKVQPSKAPAFAGAQRSRDDGVFTALLRSALDAEVTLLRSALDAEATLLRSALDAEARPDRFAHIFLGSGSSPEHN